ncbi:MAG: hypothetical protein ACK48M_06360 [Planctomycetia bacterium]
MPATKKDKARTKKQQRGAGRDAEPREEPQAETNPTQPHRPKAPRAAGKRKEEWSTVKAREAARRIRGLADLSESLDVRRRLRRLAGQIAHGSRDVQGISFIEGLLGECLDESATGQAAHEQWLACEAVAWALAWLARTRRAGGSAGGLLERLVKQARAAQGVLAARDTAPAGFVVALSRLFGDIEACRCLEHDAAQALEEEIGRLASDTGLVTVAVAGGGTASAAVVARVVRWTAAREIASATGNAALWNEATEERWQQTVATTLRLLGAEGRILTGAGGLPAAFSAPLVDAAEAAPCKRSRRTAKALRSGKASGETRDLLPRDLHAPDVGQAILRTGWGRDSLRVSLDHRQATPRLEIAAGDRLLIDGPWQWRVTVGGRPLEVDGPWVASGFESDRKATFLEIAAPLAGGLQLERQIVILPRDRVILLADAVTHPAGSPPAGPLAIESTVKPAASLETERAEETREIFVYDAAMRMMALPLAFPEWSCAAAGGGFEATDDGLVLRQTSAGSRLYSPLWLDCDPARFGRPLTWRQLTVADTRQNLPRHQAAGFRVQSGLEQWLLYRALDQPRNRTVLGCNLSCEFLLGRVRRNGSVARTLEIQ